MTSSSIFSLVAAKELPQTLSTSKISTSIELPLGQTFAMVSQRSYKDAPYEMVVIKCRGWGETKELGFVSDSLQESLVSPDESRESSAELPVARIVK